MAKHENYEKRTEELVTPIVNDLSLELYDVEFVKEAGEWYLRIYIDKEEGVTIDDCEHVSRRMSDLLDEYDYIDENYHLEVSSLGAGRSLKKDKDYDRNIGYDIEIKTYQVVNGVKEFVGTLAAYDKTTVTITIDEEEIVLEKKNISLIREYVDWDNY